MSAELLRSEAEHLRADANVGYARGHISAREMRFKRAVADWLDSVHSNLSTYNATTENSRHAFAVARAFRGEQP